MGFYELGNGCDSCATVDNLPNNMNMQMDANSTIIASMAMPYGTQNNIGKNYQNSGMLGAGYGSGMNNMGGNGAQQVVVLPTASVVKTNNNVASGQVAVVLPNGNNTNNTAKIVPVAATANNKQYSGIEGFNNGLTEGSALASTNKLLVVLGLVIFAALAGNECCKYFLNKSLQLNDGNPLYYVAYVGVAVVLAIAAFTYFTKN